MHNSSINLLINCKTGQSGSAVLSASREIWLYFGKYQGDLYPGKIHLWKSTQPFITIDHWMDLRFRGSLLTLQFLLRASSLSALTAECWEIYTSPKVSYSCHGDTEGLPSRPFFPLFSSSSSSLWGPGFPHTNALWWMTCHPSSRQIIAFVLLRLQPPAGLCFPVSTKL